MENQVKTEIKVDLDGRNRRTVFFRGILVVPVFIYLSTLTQTLHWGVSSSVITLPVILTLVFRGKYPSYLLNFNQAMVELSTRVAVYIFFLSDEYPSLERNPNISVVFPDVDGGRKLGRWQPIFKIIFAIPLVIVGIIYLIISILLTLFAWIYILIYAKYPTSVSNFVVGTFQFWNRVIGYAAVLVTDEYPSFKLS